MSSRHDGVSCDACNRNNFRLRRYKCLICYDYDLCGSCYDNGRATSSHSQAHPMQCILTQSDFDLFYSGDSDKHIGSFTCPICGQLGFSKSKLILHVLQEHKDTEKEVICPLCSSQPDGVPNRQTIRFARHLESDHSGTESSSSDNNASRHKEEFRYGSNNNPSTMAAQLRHNRHRPGIGRPPISSSAGGPFGSSTASRLSRADTSQTSIDLTGNGREREQQITQRAVQRQHDSETLADTDRIAELISQINSIRSRATIRNQLASLELQLERARAKLEERMHTTTHLSRSSNSSTPGSRTANQERPTNPLLYHLLPVDPSSAGNHHRSLRIRDIQDIEDDSDEDEEADDDDEEEEEDSRARDASFVDEQPPLDDETRLLMEDLMRLPSTSLVERSGGRVVLTSGQRQHQQTVTKETAESQRETEKQQTGTNIKKSSTHECYVIGWDEGLFRQTETSGGDDSLMSNLIAERYSLLNHPELGEPSYHHNQLLFLQEILTSSLISSRHNDSAAPVNNNPPPERIHSDGDNNSQQRLLDLDHHHSASARYFNGVNVTSNGDNESVPAHQIPDHHRDQVEATGCSPVEPARTTTASLTNSDPKSSLLSQPVASFSKSRPTFNNNDHL